MRKTPFIDLPDSYTALFIQRGFPSHVYLSIWLGCANCSNFINRHAKARATDFSLLRGERVVRASPSA